MTVDRELHPEPEKRPVWSAIMMGLKGRCPNCGHGKLFGKWLKVNHECPDCNQELHHERAQDFPPYIVILIVGHVIVTALMIVESNVELSLQTHLLIWMPLAVALCLLLLQPVKGGVVGMQWALRMFGFEEGFQE